MEVSGSINQQELVCHCSWPLLLTDVRSRQPPTNEKRRVLAVRLSSRDDGGAKYRSAHTSGTPVPPCRVLFCRHHNQRQHTVSRLPLRHHRRQ